MSGTTEAPRGLDTMTADDQALLDSMRDDGPEPAGTETPVPVASAGPDGNLEIDIPDETPPAPAPRQRSGKTVPHEALHEARELTKAEKKRADEAEQARIAAETKLATETARNTERLNILTALAQMPPQEVAPPAPVAVIEEPLPDVNTDPIGHFQEKFKRSEQQREREIAGEREGRKALEGIVNGLQEAQQRARQVAELQQWGINQELAFEAQEPTYRAAMDHLKQSRNQELMDIGITDATQRENIIAEDVNRIALKARADGANFAERLYKTALTRGFTKAAPVASAALDTGIIPPLDATVAPTQRATRLEEGRDNATTIGSIGSAPAARMSVERILALPDAEFEAITNRLKAQGGDAFKQLMGS